MLREELVAPEPSRARVLAVCASGVPGFAALDRHHDLHPIGTAANTNVLLPLGDLLMGTLRRRVSAGEAARWPAYAAARHARRAA